MRFEIRVKLILGMIPLIKPFVLEERYEEFLFEEFIVEVT